MTGLVAPWQPWRSKRRGAKPRPGTYVDNDHKPPYRQDRLWWPSALLGTYRRGDTPTETEDT